MPDGSRYVLSESERAFVERHMRQIDQLEVLQRHLLAQLDGALLLIAEQQGFAVPHTLTPDLRALEALAAQERISEHGMA